MDPTVTKGGGDAYGYAETRPVNKGQKFVLSIAKVFNNKLKIINCFEEEAILMTSRNC